MMWTVDDVTWRKLYQREDGACQRCGEEENLMPAHYKAKSLGGADTLDNLMLLCFRCHRLQHDGYLKIKKINGRYFFKLIKRSFNGF